MHFNFLHIILSETTVIIGSLVGVRCQSEGLEEMKEPEDNVLKSWVEESPHPYENDSCITKVGSKFFEYS